MSTGTRHRQRLSLARIATLPLIAVLLVPAVKAESQPLASPRYDDLPASFWWSMGALAVLLALALVFAAALMLRLNRQAKALRASENRLNTILDSVDAHIYIKDQNLKYRYVNRKRCEYFGLRPGDIIGRQDQDFFNGPALAQVQKNDLRVINRGERVAEEEEGAMGKGGPAEVFFSIKIPLRDAQGNVDSLCGISTDITQHKAAQRTAHRLAFYDPLTELPNRRLLIERMDHTREAVRKSGLFGAVLLIDLDNFKRVNDARGHAAGDTMLRDTAQRLLNIAPSGATVARIGGDEFAVLLERLGHTADDSARKAITIAEQLRNALEQSLHIEGHPIFSGGSIGLTLLRPDDKSTEDILREADTAMHRSKESGRNRVAFFEASMQAGMEEKLTLEQDLVLAIGTEQLRMAIQPQFDHLHRPVGAELLIRWQHPTQGPIPPGRFIPIAEETSVIQRIGDWVLQQACLTLLQLDAAGQTYPLSVNVSPRQFHQHDFTSRVRDILQETGAPPDRLVFEVTEGVLIEDIQGAIDRMTELRQLGIRFSIDDFGTGYSNLTSLKRFPLYELKIDKSFLHDTPCDADNAAIIKLILAMAKQLNLKVVAEGVESHEQAKFLIRHGCDSMQGYLFAKPMPLAQWLDISASARAPAAPAAS